MLIFNPDSAVRYRPVVKSIKRLQKKNRSEIKILEVGSGGSGITDFMDVRITGLDSNFDATKELNNPRVKRVVGSVVKIPFDDSSFDVVLTLDMMEHLTKSDRVSALKEMFRVLKPGGAIYCGMPVGETSRKYDGKLNNLFKKKHGQDHPWIKEHIENGLPTMEEIKNTIIKLNPSEWSVQPNMNVNAWLAMHYLVTVRDGGKIKNKAVYHINKYMNFGKAYRQIFKIVK